MNAYDIGVKLALEDAGLHKLAESITEMKNKAFAKNRAAQGYPGSKMDPPSSPARKQEMQSQVRRHVASQRAAPAQPAAAPQRAAATPTQQAPKKNLLQQTPGNVRKRRDFLNSI